MVYKDEKFFRWCFLEVVNELIKEMEDVVLFGFLRESLGLEILGK